MIKTYEEVSHYTDRTYASEHLVVEEKEGHHKHSLRGSAAVLYHENGSIRFKGWYRNDKLHRDGKPAEFWFYFGQVFPSGSQAFEELEIDSRGI